VPAESRALREMLPSALAVEMEGAAVAQVCHAFGTPLAVVRSISDRADDTAHVDFPRFLREVAGPLGRAIVQRALAP
jgi:adenosylhomocysteine nucleosidase